MYGLIAAIVIWSVIHFLPAAAPGLRDSLAQRLGTGTYKILFSIVSLGSLILITRSWGSASFENWFIPPAWGPYVTMVLTFIGFVLFFAPYMKSNLSRLTRHPQLLGIILLGIGHLFSNGEARAVVLFAGMAVWALLEMILLNRRDGAWSPPAAVSLFADFRILIAGFGFWLMMTYTHMWLFGRGAVPYF